MSNICKKHGIRNCPFCGETGFDKMGLKDHLQVYCEEYARTESIREDI